MALVFPPSGPFFRGPRLLYILLSKSKSSSADIQGKRISSLPPQWGMAEIFFFNICFQLCARERNKGAHEYGELRLEASGSPGAGVPG